LVKIIYGDWGLGIGDWGLGIGPNPQSPIPIPKSQNNFLQFFILIKNNYYNKFLNGFKRIKE